LAERAEALVLTRDGKALSAIAALREAKAGRGVFILDQPTRREEATSSLPGRALIELVRPKVGFEGTVSALLRDVRLVDDLAPVLERYAGSSIPATFVSNSGDVLTADGVVKGGGDDNGAGVLARVRESRELETEVERLDASLALAEQAYAEAEGLQTAGQNEMEACRQAQHDSALAVANQERDLGLARERCRALTLSEERRGEEIGQLSQEQGGLIQELNEAEERLSVLRTEQGEHQQALEHLETRIEEASQESADCRDRVTQCKVDRAGRIEKRDRLRSALARAEAAMHDRTEWIERREAEIQGADERSQSLLTSVEAGEGQLQGLILSEEEARTGQQGRREAFEAKSTELRTLENDVRQLRGKSGSSKEALQTESLKLQQIEMRMEHLVESIREKWDISIESWVSPVLENEPDGEDELETEAEETGENFLADILGEPSSEDEDSEETASSEAAQPISMDEAREARRLAKETGNLLALSIDERREHLEDVRRKLNSLGEVNISAIEEHEELGERYRFLSEQKDDLVSTIESLREAIGRINRTSRKRFRETFEAVNENFKKNFPRLFRGGKAELILLEAEDVLDAGIDIIAMPPGKRLQNVTLLSGGEKTMTAIALLVSLFQVHPSPFFLLDEVDAALDDANVGRFNEIVKEMANQSQFLVISHNKRTIEMADILHGVTMEHRGVSKLVSVELA
jgi:chromosome segregation protein